jgi:capsular polysaccharide biosynthesis protein
MFFGVNRGQKGEFTAIQIDTRNEMNQNNNDQHQNYNSSYNISNDYEQALQSYNKIKSQLLGFVREALWKLFRVNNSNNNRVHIR